MFQKFISGFLVCLLMASMTCSAFAAGGKTQIMDCGDGWTLEISAPEISAARASTKTASSKVTARYDGTTVGVLTLKGTFRYDGKTATATDATATVSTYDDWDADRSNWTSGATAYGACTFSKGSLSKSVSLRMTCDKNGNITTG